MHIVGISGNIARPSRTRGLVERVLDRVVARGLGDTALFDILDAGPALGTTTARKAASPELDQLWTAIETCDALVVGSPVYKSSYSGMLKHLFDLLDKDVLRDRPVLLCATGRLREYGFMIDYHLRPLFTFFQAQATPGSIYACDADYDAEGVLSPGMDIAIMAEVERLAVCLGRRHG